MSEGLWGERGQNSAVLVLVAFRGDRNDFGDRIYDMGKNTTFSIAETPQDCLDLLKDVMDVGQSIIGELTRKAHFRIRCSIPLDNQDDDSIRKAVVTGCIRALLSIELCRPVRYNEGIFLTFRDGMLREGWRDANYFRVPVPDENTCILKVSDLEAAKRINEQSWRAFSVDAKCPLATALYMCWMAHTSHHAHAQVLLFFAALEALFSIGTTEITHQLSERIACFLEARGDERIKRYEVLRDCYRKMRSPITHGGWPSIQMLQQSDGADPDALRYVARTLRDCLVRILDSEILFNRFTGNTNELQEYFKTLVLG